MHGKPHTKYHLGVTRMRRYILAPAPPKKNPHSPFLFSETQHLFQVFELGET
jgi:hypothetical protein